MTADKLSVNRASLHSEIEKMSKEEILELLKNTMLFLYVGRLTQSDINMAKAAVLRRKSEAELEQYENYKLPNLSCGASLEQQIIWMKSLQDKERHYNRYRKLWEKANRLAFGGKNAAE